MKTFARSILVILLFSGISSSCFPPKAKINWITINQLNELSAKVPKPIIFDVYTDWCGWCKEMDRKTYHNQKVVEYINEHFYAVKFDAESTESFSFNNNKYGYNEMTRSNELATYLLFGQMEFPTTVFLSSVSAKPAPLAGYLKPKEIEAPLKYFGDPANAAQTFVEFNHSFKNEW